MVQQRNVLIACLILASPLQELNLLESKGLTLIENIFTNSHNISSAGILLNDRSDHNMVFALEHVSTSAPREKLYRPDQSNKNIDTFFDILSKSNWDFIHENNNVTKIFNYFYEKINHTATFIFPLKLVKKPKTNKVR